MSEKPEYDGRSKMIAGTLEVGDYIKSGDERKRVVSVGKSWSAGDTDEVRYGIIGSPGGWQPWVDHYRVQYAYWVEDPEDKDLENGADDQSSITIEGCKVTKEAAREIYEAGVTATLGGEGSYADPTFDEWWDKQVRSRNR
jgi:hypothetical protein